MNGLIGEDCGLRVLRALRISGRRLLETKTGWAVFPRGDQRMRAVVRVGREDVLRLVALGRLRAVRSGGYVLADGVEFEAPGAGVDGVGLPVVGGAGVGRIGGDGFVGLARRGLIGDGILSRRQVLAGLRLGRDAESAERVSGTSVNWDGVPVDRDVRRGKSGDAFVDQRRSARRLENLRERVPAFEFRLACAACVEGRSLKVLARRFDLGERDVAHRLSDALEVLADAYEGARC